MTRTEALVAMIGRVHTDWGGFSSEERASAASAMLEKLGRIPVELIPGIPMREEVWERLQKALTKNCPGAELPIEAKVDLTQEVFDYMISYERYCRPLAAATNIIADAEGSGSGLSGRTVEERLETLKLCVTMLANLIPPNNKTAQRNILQILQNG